MIEGYVKKWLIKASNDLKVAENEIKMSLEDIARKVKEFVLRKLEVDDLSSVDIEEVK